MKNCFIDFFDIKKEGFTEKDIICHSLIEATIINNYSFGYIQTMMKLLNSHYCTNNEIDAVIFVLFKRYIKKALLQVNKNDIKDYINSISNDQINSPYQIAFICYFDFERSKQLREQLYSQKYKVLINEQFSINNINIPISVIYWIFKKYDHYFSNYIKNYDNINSNYILNFLYSVNPTLKSTVDVKNDPFLLNYSAFMKYERNNLNVVFDIKNFKLPEKNSLELIKILKNELNIYNLLQIKRSQDEINNLCSIIALYSMNYTKYEFLFDLRNSISKRSLMILLIVYSKYSCEKLTSEIINFIFEQININDSDDIFFIKFILKKLKNSCDNIPIDFFYIQTELDLDIIQTKKILSVQYYGYIKQELAKGNCNVKGFELVIQKYKRNFKRLLDNVIYSKTGFISLPEFDYSEFFDLKEITKLIISKCNNNCFEKAYNLIMLLPESKEVKKFFIQKEENINALKTLANNLSIEKATKLCEIFYIKDLIPFEQKQSYYYSSINEFAYLHIDRGSIIQSSMRNFEDKNINKKIIKIEYQFELGIDGGGLSKDWFSSVSKVLNDLRIFKEVPNGDSLTLSDYKDENVLRFVGQFIGAAFNNNICIGMRLSSFIWKQLIEEEITLDDMNQYDSKIYLSLKWIEWNNVDELDETFVDSNNDELCENGRNVKLTNNNKDKYIKLMVKRILFGKNKKSFEIISKGFKEVVDFNKIKMFNSDEIKNIIIGKLYIDVDDWKENSYYEYEYDYYIDSFFSFVSNWSEEEKQLLLKFVTGLSVVPICGFKELDNLGGIFNIQICEISFPKAATCTNTLFIPYLDDINELESRLLTAIRNEEFGFS